RTQSSRFGMTPSDLTSPFCSVTATAIVSAWTSKPTNFTLFIDRLLSLVALYCRSSDSQHNPRLRIGAGHSIVTKGSNRCLDLQSILGITIKDDEPRSGSKWKCFSQLLDDPRAGRMLCDIEVQYAPTIVTDDEEAIEHAEGDRRNSEEVHRG